MVRCVRGFKVVLLVLIYSSLSLFPPQIHQPFDQLAAKSLIAKKERLWVQTEYQLMQMTMHEVNNAMSGIMNYAALYQLGFKKGRTQTGPESSKLLFIASIIMNRVVPAYERYRTALKRIPESNYSKTTFNEAYGVLIQFKSVLARVFKEVKTFRIDHRALTEKDKEFYMQEILSFNQSLASLNAYFQDDNLELRPFLVYDFIEDHNQLVFQQGFDSVLYDIDEIKGVQINGNHYLIKLIFHNFVSNAKKHGHARRLWVNGYQVEDNLVVEVANDVGEGGTYIPEPWLEKVPVVEKKGRFAKEQRVFVEPYTTSKDDGNPHGIGLKYIYNLAKVMGGSIHVDSSPEQTRFYLVLPISGTKLSRSGSGSLRLLAVKTTEAAHQEIHSSGKYIRVSSSL